MLENRSYIKIKISSERSFGIVFSIIFAIIGLYPLLYGNNINLWSCLISVILLFFAFFLPKTLIVPNKLWFKFGMLLGSIVAPIIMALIYFLTITPTGLIMRLLKKDLLLKKFNKSAKSYWITRNESVNSMKNQF
tara:strand:+ start:1534 stop:1938 length:405 start_codon:yes stop_codon:yes gene_type:complete